MTATEPLTDTELKARFLDTTLGADQFHHADHVRMAWLFVSDYGMPAALERFPAALRRFADAKGATSLYHATITWAFLLLIHERQVRQPAADWPGFAAANPDLLTWKPSILDRFYTRETLWSDVARQTFVMPDRHTASQTD
jgi:hypothetical protein